MAAPLLKLSICCLAASALVPKLPTLSDVAPAPAPILSMFALACTAPPLNLESVGLISGPILILGVLFLSTVDLLPSRIALEMSNVALYKSSLSDSSSLRNFSVFFASSLALSTNSLNFVEFVLFRSVSCFNIN